MAMYDSFLDILSTLRNDEKLNRLLVYPSQDDVNGILDPLDESLPNILELPSEELTKLRNEHILKSAKISDLIDKKICRIYIYAGNRIPEMNRNNSYLFAEQQIKIDVIVHNDIENEDIRMERILDKLNELLCLKRITAIGKMDYVSGHPINAPRDYVGYQVVYKFGSTKA